MRNDSLIRKTEVQQKIEFKQKYIVSQRYKLHVKSISNVCSIELCGIQHSANCFQFEINKKQEQQTQKKKIEKNETNQSIVKQILYKNTRVVEPNISVNLKISQNRCILVVRISNQRPLYYPWLNWPNIVDGCHETSKTQQNFYYAEIINREQKKKLSGESVEYKRNKKKVANNSLTSATNMYALFSCI